MTDTEIRIALAEAMGIDPEIAWDVVDPLTDANDDYAVLEWMRENSPLLFTPSFWREFNQAHLMSVYTPGDYARAAYKVVSGR